MILFSIYLNVSPTLFQCCKRIVSGLFSFAGSATRPGSPRPLRLSPDRSRSPSPPSRHLSWSPTPPSLNCLLLGRFVVCTLKGKYSFALIDTLSNFSLILPPNCRYIVSLHGAPHNEIYHL